MSCGLPPAVYFMSTKSPEMQSDVQVMLCVPLHISPPLGDIISIEEMAPRAPPARTESVRTEARTRTEMSMNLLWEAGIPEKNSIEKIGGLFLNVFGDGITIVVHGVCFERVVKRPEEVRT